MITLQLPDEIEERARAAGLLTNEKITSLIEGELERQREVARDEAIRVTRDILARLHALEPPMTEEEIAAELAKPSSRS